MKKSYFLLSVIISIFCFTLFMFMLIKIEISLQNIEDNGRYVMHIHPSIRADKYVLDKKTGKVWQIVQDSNSDELFWVQMGFKSFIPDKEGNGVLKGFVSPSNAEKHIK